MQFVSVLCASTPPPSPLPSFSWAMYQPRESEEQIVEALDQNAKVTLWCARACARPLLSQT